MTNQNEFSLSVQRILKKDQRYNHKAYFFLRDALEFTIKGHDPQQLLDKGHISGKTLLDGIRKFAIEQYGPLTMHVLDDWGIKSCEDFGEIVFNLVEVGVLGKNDQDSKDDFKGAYNFKEAFLQPFDPLDTPPFPETPKKRASTRKK